MRSQGSTPSKRVLIADDDPVMRQLLKSIVAKEGYEAVVVQDGAKRIESYNQTLISEVESSI